MSLFITLLFEPEDRHGSKKIKQITTFSLKIDPTNAIVVFTDVQPVYVKGIVHPKMKIWCLSAYPKGIQDVGDFVSSVEHKDF